jgi:hypothetical protein
MSWSTKYSILLMRDTSTAYRFRVSAAWLRLGAAGAVLLLILAMAGVYVGVRSYAEGLVMKGEKTALLQRVGEMEQQIQRLGNVESILGALNEEDLRFLTPTVDLGRPAQIVLPLDLKELFDRTDMKVVSVRNVQARFSEQVLSVSYDLNSLQSGGRVSGTVRFAIVTREGVILELTEPGQESFFEITRFKQNRDSLTIPQNMDREDLFGLRVHITDPSDRIIFSELYPLESIVS